MAAGLVFYAIAVGVLWYALDLALGESVHEPWAALVLSVVLASYSSAALELLIAAPVFGLLSVHSGRGRTWVPAGLAVLAAGLIQVNSPTGCTSQCLR